MGEGTGYIDLPSINYIRFYQWELFEKKVSTGLLFTSRFLNSLVYIFEKKTSAFVNNVYCALFFEIEKLFENNCNVTITVCQLFKQKRRYILYSFLRVDM